MFLRKRDYFTEIREVDLEKIVLQISQTTAQNPAIIIDENQLDVQEKVATMIRHRYDDRKIFKQIIPFVLSDTYQVGDLIEYSEPAHDPLITYAINVRRSFSQTINNVLDDSIFQSNIAIGTPEAFDPTKWDRITENASLYFAEKPTTGNLPDTAFSFTINNFTGNHDQIRGWDKTRTIFLERLDPFIRIYYSAADRTNKVNSIGIVDFDFQQEEFPTNIPIERGDDSENSIAGDLSIIGFIPDGTEWDVVASNFFTKGDNRDRVIKRIVLAIAIFELHKLISPRNIPDMRIDANIAAMEMLKKISSGKITADLPIFHDKERGQSITFDSNPKQRFLY